MGKRNNYPKIEQKKFSAEKIFQILVKILPGVLYFSYWPVISLGQNETMNFELSLPLIWLVLFDILIIYLVTKKKAWGELVKKWPWLFLPVWMTMTVFWSLNFTRGVMTVGILWLIYLAGGGFFVMRESLGGEKFRRSFFRWFFGAGIVAVIWCVVQCVLDLNGVGREVTLMCAGCTYRMFGFPHPNGMAIEPQFMGNLLLAPAIMAGYYATKKKNLWLFFILAFGVFLTFSRGAIYAFGLSMILMLIIMSVRWRRYLRCLWVFLAMIAAFAGTLTMQGVMAEVSRTDDTFGTGVAKVIEHLSLGVIKFEKKTGVSGVAEKEVVEMGDNLGNTTVSGYYDGFNEDFSGDLGDSDDDSISDNPGEQAVFDGYVAESTDTRVRLSRVAVEIWQQDFATAMFGVGLGGAGQALYNHGLSPAPKEIVQNEYVSLLLETGVIGIVLLLYTVGLIGRVLWGRPEQIVTMIIIVGYGVTLCFFSGLANALQIYLLPMVIYDVMAKKKALKNRAR